MLGIHRAFHKSEFRCSCIHLGNCSIGIDWASCSDMDIDRRCVVVGLDRVVVRRVALLPCCRMHWWCLDWCVGWHSLDQCCLWYLPLVVALVVGDVGVLRTFRMHCRVDVDIVLP